MGGGDGGGGVTAGVDMIANEGKWKLLGLAWTDRARLLLGVTQKMK